ncbi:MAG: response regulator [Myxococcales bacterium]|nr:response regulator [Myxococcales bacterium]
MSKLILIVDDEPDLVVTLDYNLKKEGFQTRTAANGEEALMAARQEPLPDLVLLDLMLPDTSGTEICRKLRANERTRAIPVVMLTAKGEEIDRVVGFEVGADDYVVKPFSVRELVLRVHAVLRRSEAQDPGTSERFVFGQLSLDPAGHNVTVAGNQVDLTALEFRLLHCFVSRKGRVQTRDSLLSEVWGINAQQTTRTVDTHVKRLREKLGSVGCYIETLRGVGYRFRETPD